MRGKNSHNLWPAVALASALGILFLPAIARARKINETMQDGIYSITLKVLPAESFEGLHPEMKQDGGAEPITLNGPEHPNHHLVAFVNERGKPVENATVSISYRELSPAAGEWMPLPVVRMHVAGKGLKTTHYGNNVLLGPGSYEARVTVNGGAPVVFPFSLSK